MSSEDIIVKLVQVGIIPHPAIADIVLNTCRQFQCVRAYLSYISLQMHLVTEVVIMVARCPCIINVTQYGRVGNASKERIAPSYRRPVCNVRIDVMLFQREIASVNTLSY